ncbi:HD domain-containing protein [Amycolatopsis magusensis]|uniref:HD domain-containing protein n=1 Tax=Amycolatopsis magusensis TaxID=882444 RepID=UPI003C2E48B7
MTYSEEAQRVAQELVEPLETRWRHVQAVAFRSTELTDAVAANQRDELVAAAWLHDIGYSPSIKCTGFHPLDGALHLQANEWPSAIVNLVAHHSGARFEAAERGMSQQLARFPFRDSATLDALVTADLTTGPGGERFTYDERIAEILKRYPPEDPVHRTWAKAAPILKEAVRRTEERLAKAQPK